MKLKEIMFVGEEDTGKRIYCPSSWIFYFYRRRYFRRTGGGEDIDA